MCGKFALYAKAWPLAVSYTHLDVYKRQVFHSLKGELGLRPIYHHKEGRSDGHLFITVLAYQCVQFLRVKLKAAGITDSWATLRDILSVQRRVTATCLLYTSKTLFQRYCLILQL